MRHAPDWQPPGMLHVRCYQPCETWQGGGEKALPANQRRLLRLPLGQRRLRRLQQPPLVQLASLKCHTVCMLTAETTPSSFIPLLCKYAGAKSDTALWPLSLSCRPAPPLQLSHLIPGTTWAVLPRGLPRWVHTTAVVLGYVDDQLAMQQ